MIIYKLQTAIILHLHFAKLTIAASPHSDCTMYPQPSILQSDIVIPFFYLSDNPSQPVPSSSSSTQPPSQPANTTSPLQNTNSNSSSVESYEEEEEEEENHQFQSTHFQVIHEVFPLQQPLLFCPLPPSPPLRVPTNTKTTTTTVTTFGMPPTTPQSSPPSVLSSNLPPSTSQAVSSSTQSSSKPLPRQQIQLNSFEQQLQNLFDVIPTEKFLENLNYPYISHTTTQSKPKSTIKNLFSL